MAGTTYKLTRGQADTLLAMRSAARAYTDTTVEVTYFDNSAPGTGRRLGQLARMGLVERGESRGQRWGYAWKFTDAGRALAAVVHLADCRARGEARRAGLPALGPPPDLGGTYTVEAA